MSLALRLVQAYAVASFLGLWAVIGWSDWFQKKIFHRHLRWGAALVLAGWAVLAANTMAGALELVRVYHFASFYLVNLGYLALSTAAALAFWWLRIWPAGDAKLFALLAAIFPLIQIKGLSHPRTLSLEVLINIFIPAALFFSLRATWYVWNSRLRHAALFFRQLGLRRGAGFLRVKLGELAASLPAPDRWWSGIASWAESQRRDPAGTAAAVLQWGLMLACFFFVSLHTRHLIRSVVLFSLLSFGLMYLWSRAIQNIGRWPALAVSAAVFAALWYLTPGVTARELGLYFARMGVLTLFIVVGMGIAQHMLRGQPQLLLILWLAGFVIPMLIGVLWSTVNARLHQGNPFSAPSLPSLPALQVPEALAPLLPTLALLSFFGAFFGISLVFVRIWDSEIYPVMPVCEIRPFLKPSAAFLEKVKEGDSRFYERHLRDLYADGLTPRQARALKGWCARQAIAEVPLAPTVSFAAWIFAGYGLSWLTGGHVLQLVF